jgi:hypothetical protein
LEGGCVGVQYVTSCGTPFLLLFCGGTADTLEALTVSEVAQGQVVGFSSNPRWSNGADDYGFFFLWFADSPLTLWQLVYQALFWDSAIFSHAVVEGDPLLCIA